MIIRVLAASARNQISSKISITILALNGIRRTARNVPIATAHLIGYFCPLVVLLHLLSDSRADRVSEIVYFGGRLVTELIQICRA